LLEADLLGDTQVLTPEEMKEHVARRVGSPSGMKERG
jgi:hypothetical protein